MADGRRRSRKSPGLSRAERSPTFFANLASSLSQELAGSIQDAATEDFLVRLINCRTSSLNRGMSPPKNTRIS